MPNKNYVTIHPAVLNRMSHMEWCITPDSMRLLIDIVEGGGDIAQAEQIREKRRQMITGFHVPKNVAMIPILGPIVPFADSFTDTSGLTALADVRHELALAEADPSKNLIVLLADSPGGDATGISEMAHNIRRIASTRKRVVVYGLGGVNSGMYWLGVAGSKLVLAPNAEAGSIGALTIRRDGVKNTLIIAERSPNKVIDSAVPEDFRRIMDSLNELTLMFEQEVALFRGVDHGKVEREFGNGLSFKAAEAVRRGMADAVMTFHDMLQQELEMTTEEQTRLEKAEADAKATQVQNSQMVETLETLKAQLSASTKRVQELEAALVSSQQSHDVLLAAMHEKSLDELFGPLTGTAMSKDEVTLLRGVLSTLDKENPKAAKDLRQAISIRQTQSTTVLQTGIDTIQGAADPEMRRKNLVLAVLSHVPGKKKAATAV